MTILLYKSSWTLDEILNTVSLQEIAEELYPAAHEVSYERAIDYFEEFVARKQNSRTILKTRNNRDIKQDINNVSSVDLENTSKMKVLNLTAADTPILSWLGTMLSSRELMLPFNANSRQKIICDKYAIDTNQYDYVLAYSLDDFGLQYTIDFIQDSIGLESIQQAIELNQFSKTYYPLNNGKLPFHVSNDISLEEKIATYSPIFSNGLQDRLYVKALTKAINDNDTDALKPFEQATMP